MDFVQIYGAILIQIVIVFNTVITLAPVLTHNLKRTVKCNRNDLKKVLLLLCRKISY